MTRRFHLILLLFLFLLLLPVPGKTEAQFIQSPYFAKAKSDEPLVIALTNNTPPFCLRDENGLPQGIDVELAHRLGEILNTDIVFVYPEFQEIFGLIEEGSVDLAIANIVITIERSMRVSFSHSYMDITQGALLDRRFIPREIVEGEVRDVSIKTYADLAKIPGLVVGTWGNTSSESLTKSFSLNLEHHSFDSILDARQALLRGEINALLADSPIIEFMSNYFEDDRKRFKTLIEPTTEERLAIAVRMGDPTFVDFLNEVVDELRADGTVQRWADQFIEETAWAREVLR